LTSSPAAGGLRVLLTGAAGCIGRDLRAGLRGRYALLRVTEVRDPGPAAAGEEAVPADLSSPEATAALMRGIDVVLHFAGMPREAPWDAVLRNNIIATYNVFEAARANGVRRIVYASSNPVVGFYRADRPLGTTEAPRPDSRYGVSKVFGEGLARLYADKHGIGVAALRIGSYRQTPENVRQLATWCSPRDLLGLVVRCIEVADLHFEVFYGVSANQRSRWHDDAARRIGFVPRDDAEAYASRFPAESRPDSADPAVRFHGGHLAAVEFDADPDAID
jgi:uronate dehydrogenase